MRRERIRLTTFRDLYRQRDLGRLCTPGDTTRVSAGPLKPAELDPHPVLGLEPLSRLSSALVTMRNTKASLTLSLSLIPRRRFAVRLGSPTAAARLEPHRCQ